MTKMLTKKDKILLALLYATAFVLGSLGAIRIYNNVTGMGYGLTSSWQIYEGNGLSFRYPEKWKAKFCFSNSGDLTSSFELPGKVSGTVPDNVRYRLVKGNLTIGGYSFSDGLGCEKSKLSIRPQHPQICEDVKRDGAIRLKNDTRVQFIEQGAGVRYISIQRNDCQMSQLFMFRVLPEGMSPEDVMPDAAGVKKGDLLNSPQYKDIVRFAESIKIKEQ